MNDLISRQAAIDAMYKLCDECDSDECGECRLIYDHRSDKSRDSIYVLEHLPSAPSKQKTGKWIDRTVDVDAKKSIEEWQSAKCSVCGLYHTTPYLYYFSHYNFCPSCGAKMEEGKDE